MKLATAAQLKDMAPSQTTEQEANTVNQKESSKKPKTTKEKSRDPKDQLSAECISTSGKGTNALHMEKHALRVEKPTIL